MKINQLVNQLVVARRLKLSITSLAILSYLYENNEQKVGVIAAHLGIHTAALTGMAESLENLGFAVRKHGKSDRRTVWLSITYSGFAAMEEITEAGKAQLATA
ncbi:MarR family transcriptional regulator [Luteolibacter pohnpeiensis]|uniref:MarR family transcriptional regulator n=1 Tax=Luteolibacter pohnpeiensis TaxID=454153 RepID=A0A934SDZ1_9BACT|nr:MarR family transcriptional regulator [Luteolibacter pohnpeiensis]MBK1884124.1 MarR family transcriptional regulator [Luteolibacter pohnpeiensis]